LVSKSDAKKIKKVQKYFQFNSSNFMRKTTLYKKLINKSNLLSSNNWRPKSKKARLSTPKSRKSKSIKKLITSSV